MRIDIQNKEPWQTIANAHWNPGWLAALLVCCLWCGLPTRTHAQSDSLQWSALPPIPDELGLAGPIVGVHDDVLVAGGGANFARPVWDNAKKWQARLFALDLRRTPRTWQAVGALPGPLAYSACASTPLGIAVLGGNDQHQESRLSRLLQVKRLTAERLAIDIQPLPVLPQALVYAQAVYTDERLIVLSGQTGSALSTAIAGGWSMQFKDTRSLPSNRWEPIAACPGGPRAFAMASSVQTRPGQVWLLGGRRQTGESVEFLSDVWQYQVATDSWQASTNLPVAVAAGGVGMLGNMLAVVSGDDGALFTRTDELRDNHPGFAKRTWLFDLDKQLWTSGGQSPDNQVTTTPVAWGNRLLIVSGEIRPRVRTNQVWQVELDSRP